MHNSVTNNVVLTISQVQEKKKIRIRGYAAMKQYQISFKNAEDSASSFSELRERISPGQESRMLF